MKKIKYVIPLFLASQFIGHVALANDSNSYAQGLKAEFAGDYNTAIAHYKKSENLGLSDASFAIARLYKMQGDYASSKESFLKAAQAGNTFAQYEIGLSYLHGDSIVASDRTQAIKWLTRAATSKHGEASYELFKLVGDIQWLKLAAEQGIREAMQSLSLAYKEGLYGVAINLDESEHWAQQFTTSQD